MQIRRQSDASGLEDAADLAGDGGASGNALAVLLNRGFLEAVEIAQPPEGLRFSKLPSPIRWSLWERSSSKSYGAQKHNSG
ncbi:MAG TPA: hypothetical protein VNZ53_59150, partial [Steroidobacteraceae bacterium]|nr:hypothetical protein [Steroidobacteraceae bacterium]